MSENPGEPGSFAQILCQNQGLIREIQGEFCQSLLALLLVY